jgi:hypothetical protein
LLSRKNIGKGLDISRKFHQGELDALDAFGGFPDPFIRQSKQPVLTGLKRV